MINYNQINFTFLRLCVRNLQIRIQQTGHLVLIFDRPLQICHRYVETVKGQSIIVLLWLEFVVYTRHYVNISKFIFHSIKIPANDEIFLLSFIRDSTIENFRHWIKLSPNLRNSIVTVQRSMQSLEWFQDSSHHRSIQATFNADAATH